MVNASRGTQEIRERLESIDLELEVSRTFTEDWKKSSMSSERIRKNKSPLVLLESLFSFFLGKKERGNP